MGRIYDVAKIASRVPWLANELFSAPGLSAALKFAGGIAPQRTMPRFAKQTFVSWFRKHQRQAQGGPRVLLWPDTFNNFFRPETAIAATRVLEAAGFSVALPDVSLCCGRPLYDWGWIEPAKRLWQKTLAALKDDIEAGTPLVGLEPACLSAFRDELPNLFPNDQSAQRLSRQSVFFSDFLAKHWPGNGTKVNGRVKALVQLHCHQHAIIKPDGENKLLGHLGAGYEILKSGCCGMAGAFGFERDHYDISLAIGERALLPAVRAAEPEALIVTNGFSCREQIEQGTGRQTRHVAELLAEAMGFPAQEPSRPRDLGRTVLAVGAVVATGLLVGALLSRQASRNRARLSR
jgi:Fe-S oxidoreductase